MSNSAATVLVVADGREPVAPAVDPGGRAASSLGAGRRADLRRILTARALEWAASVAPTATLVSARAEALTDAGTETSIEALADARTEALADARTEALADAAAGALADAPTEALAEAAAGALADARTGALAEAVARAFRASAGPVLIAWPELPRWRPTHAAGALDDLAHGCDVSIGPIYDGGLYLLALGRPLPQLLARLASAWGGPDAMGAALDAVQGAGLAVGLLRAERGLRSEGDVAAALADPLLDDELRQLLS